MAKPTNAELESELAVTKSLLRSVVRETEYWSSQTYFYQDKWIKESKLREKTQYTVVIIAVIYFILLVALVIATV